MLERKWPKNLASSPGTTGKPAENFQQRERSLSPRDVPCIMEHKKRAFWRERERVRERDGGPERAFLLSLSLRSLRFFSAHYYYYFYLYFTFVVGTLNISCLSSSLRFEPAKRERGRRWRWRRWAGQRSVAAVHVMVMVTYSSHFPAPQNIPHNVSVAASVSLSLRLILLSFPFRWLPRRA